MTELSVAWIVIVWSVLGLTTWIVIATKTEMMERGRLSEAFKMLLLLAVPCGPAALFMNVVYIFILIVTPPVDAAIEWFVKFVKG